MPISQFKRIGKKIYSICPMIQISIKICLILLWPMSHHSTKFCGNPSSCFCVIVLTTKQTNKFWSDSVIGTSVRIKSFWKNSYRLHDCCVKLNQQSHDRLNVLQRLLYNSHLFSYHSHSFNKSGTCGYLSKHYGLNWGNNCHSRVLRIWVR